MNWFTYFDKWQVISLFDYYFDALWLIEEKSVGELFVGSNHFVMKHTGLFL